MKARKSQHAETAGLPYLSLVDTLFGAFAAILATATVLVAFERTRESSHLLPASPAFALFVKSLDASTCPVSGQDLGIRVFQGDAPPDDAPQGVRYSLATEINRVAAGIAPRQPSLNAWYIASTDDRTSICGPDCVEAALVVLTAKVASYSFRPDITTTDSCDRANIRVAFKFGLADKPPDDKDYVPLSSPPTLKIAVIGPS